MAPKLWIGIYCVLAALGGAFGGVLATTPLGMLSAPALDPQAHWVVQGMNVFTETLAPLIATVAILVAGPLVAGFLAMSLVEACQRPWNAVVGRMQPDDDASTPLDLHELTLDASLIATIAAYAATLLTVGVATLI